MPPVLPDSRAEQIQWFALRLPAWQADPAAIGLTPAQVGELADLLARAEADLAAAHAAREAARIATAAHHESADSLRDAGARLIATIKAFAATPGQMDAYEAAMIPRPRPRTRRPAPAAPSRPAAAIAPTGEVTLTWEAPRLPGRADGAGVQYVIHRRLQLPDGALLPPELLGVTGSRRFVDDAIPPGAAGAQYTVQPRRGTAAGPTSPIAAVTFPGSPPSPPTAPSPTAPSPPAPLTSPFPLSSPAPRPRSKPGRSADAAAVVAAAA